MWKPFFILTLAVFISVLRLNAQVGQVFNGTNNFETGTMPAIIDTLQPGNVWQMGVPHKNFLDTAWSGTKVIITDTLLPYPVYNTSSFTIKAYSPPPLYPTLYTQLLIP